MLNLYYLRRLMTHSLLLALLLTTAHVYATVSDSPPAVEDFIVKVHVTSKMHEVESPWNANVISSSGSGVIIEGERILTNAHVVADNTFIEIQRDGHSRRYQAEVEAISHETDLALLKVHDKSFFGEGGFLPLGELPDVHQDVTVYGYPVGGNTLSITRGVVSRIEFQTYVHSGLSFQAIQVDAAINYGNSGGPALADGKVIGIAMQISGGNDENIGYLIPVTMVKRFLTDLADGSNDGLPELSLLTDDLLNPTLKNHYHLDDDQSGVLVTKVCADTPTEKVIHTSDVITHIDGKRVEDNGMISLTPTKQIHYFNQVDMHQVGEVLSLGIVRDGKPMQVEVPLTKTVETRYDYDEAPVYFVYGGFVFVKEDDDKGCVSRESFDKDDRQQRQEYVRVTQVLASPDNVGFHDVASFYVEKINGETFDTFREFHTLLKTGATPTILLENMSGQQLAIDRKNAESGHQDLLKKYVIQKASSDEVLQWERDLARGLSGSETENRSPYLPGGRETKEPYGEKANQAAAK